jgi:hypothetical protein
VHFRVVALVGFFQANSCLLCFVELPFRSAYKRWKRGEVTHAQPDRMAMLEAAGFGQLYPDLQGKNNAHSEDNDHEKHPESDEHD